MFLCIFVEAFYEFKMVIFIKLKKEADLFLISSSLLFLKQLAILPLRVYFILNKINNHAV